MSSHWYRLMREEGPGNTTDRYVMVTLADYARDNGQSWPKIDDIRRRTCLSDSGIRNSLKRLEAGGWITTTHRPSPQPSLYQLHDPADRMKFTVKNRTTQPLRGDGTKARRRRKEPLRGNASSGNASSGNALRGGKEPLRGNGSPAPLIRNKHKYTQVHLTPTPIPQAGQGSGAVHLPPPKVTTHDHTDDALDRVMRELGMTDPRLKKKLRDPLVLWKEHNTGSAYDAADAMISAWREYQSMGQLRRFVWNPQKFFTHGHWLDPGSWPADPQELGRRRSMVH